MPTASDPQQLSPLQSSTVQKIRALRKLTESTGTRTTRTVNEILRALPAADLTVVALELERGQQAGR